MTQMGRLSVSRVPSSARGAHRVDTHLGADTDRLMLQGHRDGFHVEQRPTCVVVTPGGLCGKETHLPTEKTWRPVRSLSGRSPEGETATH